MRGKNHVLQILNILAYLAMIGVNWLANALPIGGYKTGEIADLYPNLFTPIGITFSIWGVIYILLGVFVIYQGRDLFSRRKDNIYYVEHISGWFVLSCVANISWLLAWHYRRIPLSLLLMMILLFSLVRIYLNLNIGRAKADSSVKLYVQLPFRIYLGWITVATIANLTTLFVYLGWNGMGFLASIWTIFGIILGTIITFRVLRTRRDTVYSITIVWAYLGIALKRLTEVPKYPAIVFVAILCMAAIVFFMAFRRD